jgi:hypothetical protein
MHVIELKGRLWKSNRLEAVLDVLRRTVRIQSPRISKIDVSMEKTVEREDILQLPSSARRVRMYRGTSYIGSPKRAQSSVYDIRAKPGGDAEARQLGCPDGLPLSKLEVRLREPSKNPQDALERAREVVQGRKVYDLSGFPEGHWSRWLARFIRQVGGLSAFVDALVQATGRSHDEVRSEILDVLAPYETAEFESRLEEAEHDLLAQMTAVINALRGREFVIDWKPPPPPIPDLRGMPPPVTGLFHRSGVAGHFDTPGASPRWNRQWMNKKTRRSAGRSKSLKATGP